MDRFLGYHKNAPNKGKTRKNSLTSCAGPTFALKNFECITYSTPNDAARELIEDEDIRNSKIAFPTLSDYR